MSETIDPKTIEAISASVAKKINHETVKRAKQDRDWRLRNTKLLLKNYHILKEHCVNVDASIKEYEESIFDPEEIELESIMASKAKTRKMVWYIDEMLAAYSRYANKAGEAAQRRYTTLDHYYIQPKRPSYDALGDLFSVSERTVRRDLEDARKEFSVFLFGVFAIEDLDTE